MKTLQGKRFFRGIAGALLFGTLFGCFVPQTEPSRQSNCQLVTREWTLDVQGLEGDQTVVVDGLSGMMRQCQDPECLLANLAILSAGVVTVSAGSFVVSGSIVVVGNTVHWLEQQGSCDDSFTQRTVSAFVDGFRSAGGFVVTSSKQLMDWFTAPFGD